jgi:hypothetical protein
VARGRVLTDDAEPVEDADGRIFACARCSGWTGDPGGHLTEHHPDAPPLGTFDFRLVRGRTHKSTSPREKGLPQDEALFA